MPICWRNSTWRNGSSAVVRNGGVGQRIHGETLAWVADVVDDAAGGTDVAQIDLFLRIQMAAVLDGIHEQLAESSGDLFAHVGIQIAGQFTHELGETVGGGKPAARSAAKSNSACPKGS